LSLADIQALTSELLKCGARINEINTVRKHCLRIAGGGLAALAAPARVASLIISDVVGSPFDVIASGATAPDPSTFADAWAVVENHGLEDVLPSAVTSHLRRGMEGKMPETPKPTAPLWRRVHNSLVASNVTAAEAAVVAARERGFETTLLTTFLEGEAREVGRVFASIARELVRRRASRERPMLFVAGGETTVTLRGQGEGGRNQELALGAARGLAGLPGVLLATLATDGGDGPTDAAGATVTGGTLELARARGIDPNEFLKRNDSYNFFAPLGALLRPGPTLTNVNDLLFLLIDAWATDSTQDHLPVTSTQKRVIECHMD
jgi:hydroxypyruvate reductase